MTHLCSRCGEPCNCGSTVCIHVCSIRVSRLEGTFNTWGASVTEMARLREQLRNAERDLEVANRKLEFLRKKGITVAPSKEAGKPECLAYVVEPGSELDDLPILNELIDLELRMGKIVGAAKALVSDLEWVSDGSKDACPVCKEIKCKGVHKEGCLMGEFVKVVLSG